MYKRNSSFGCKKLQSLGNTAIKLQIDSGSSTDYVTRVSQANLEGGDYFVEIHLNAGGGTGCEVYTTNGSSASSLAQKFQALLQVI